MLYNKIMDDKAKEKEIKEEKTYNYHGNVYEETTDVLYFSSENSLNKFQHALLGDFNSAGQYKIAEDVLKKLVEIKKVVSKKEDEVLYLKSDTSLKTFHFTVITGSAPNNKLFAQLRVIETVGDVEHKNTLTTHVVYYTDVNDAFFEAKYKKAFNIVLAADGGKEENDKILADLLTKIKFGNAVYKRYLTENKLKDKIYVEKMLKILAQSKEGSVILAKYQALLEKNKGSLLPTNKDYYRALKQLLDGVIEQNKKTLPKESVVLINRLRDVYVKANTMTIDGIVAQEKAKEKAPAAPAKSGASKAASGGGGGGGGKKNAGKPAAKKPEAKKNSTSPFINQNPPKENKEKEKEQKKEEKKPTNSVFSTLVKEFKNQKYETATKFKIKKVEIENAPTKDM